MSSDFLEEREAENGLFLGQLTRLNDTPASTTPFMVAVKAGPLMISAAFYRELYLVVSRGPKEVWQIIVSNLKETGIDIPNVVRPAVEAQQFATTWAQARGCESNLAMDQRLYQLTRVNLPTGIPGSARLVTDNDVDTLILWIQEFFQEILAWEMPPIEQIQENTRARVPLKMTYFWEIEGKPVAMAALARPSRRGITINAVYTPPEYRRRGYATALVAALSAEGLGRGKSFCILYTDVLNSISNSIYQKIGYQPVSSEEARDSEANDHADHHANVQKYFDWRMGGIHTQYKPAVNRYLIWLGLRTAASAQYFSQSASYSFSDARDP